MSFWEQQVTGRTSGVWCAGTAGGSG
ncbi:hypothetical protein E2C01_082957 [Portunus trituberculatus]|uniref:Uncharacterized protein n=1 Tax=Portunus trituberculatus TaxID=210409 RepID=A0A5B7J552_PORTR|nr:hypothetical protein [Portunus trituberculatus]